MASERKKFTFENLVTIYFKNIHRIVFTNILFAVPTGIIAIILYFISKPLGEVWNIIITMLVIPICYPFLSGVTLIVRNLGRGEEVNVLETFISSVKDNYRQFLFQSFVIYPILTIGIFTFSFYRVMALSMGGAMYVLLFVTILISLWLLFAFFYIPLMTVTFELSNKDILKNSALMALGELKVNFVSLFSLLILTAICSTPLIFTVGNMIALIIVAVVMLVFIYPASAVLVSTFFVQSNMVMMITGKGEQLHDIKSTEEKLASLKNETKDDFADVDIEKVKKSNDDYIFHNGKMIKKDILIEMFEAKENEKNG